METKAPNVHEPHWYLTVTNECVACGAGGTHRERKAGAKPEDPADRYRYEPELCTYCKFPL